MCRAGAQCPGILEMESTWTIFITCTILRSQITKTKQINQKPNYQGASQLDGLDRAALEIVDEHWAQFPPQHPLANHLIGIAYFFLFIISFFGNGSVIYIFLKVKSLRTPSNMFVVNLAFSDWAMMITQVSSII